MGQEDYLKRQLDQLGQVLSKMLTGLLGLKEKKSDLTDGIEQTNQLLKAELGFTSDEFSALQNEELIRMLEAEKGFKKSHFEKLADLLLFLADHASDMEKRKQLYEKCLVIFQHIEKSENTYSFERHAKVEGINRVLNEL